MIVDPPTCLIFNINIKLNKLKNRGDITIELYHYGY